LREIPFEFLSKLVRTDTFWIHLAESMRAFAAALVIAIVLGLLIGFALGLHRCPVTRSSRCWSRFIRSRRSRFIRFCC
jgi:ABC-type nitrate/sulfonate/bicarbonate transport system permease component